MKVYVLIEIWELSDVRTETVIEAFLSKELALTFVDKLKVRQEDTTAVKYTYEIVEKEVVEEC